MDRMLSVKWTVFFEFQLFLSIPPVFACGIVFPFALSALERYQLHYLFLTRHILLLRLLTSRLFYLYNTIAIKMQSIFISPRSYKRSAADLQLSFTYGKNRALDQNRTDDLILTMDMLCQLSYKGTITLILQCSGKIAILDSLVNRYGGFSLIFCTNLCVN